MDYANWQPFTEHSGVAGDGRLGELIVALMMVCFQVFLSHNVEDPVRCAYVEREVREHGPRINDSIQWLNGAVR